MYSNRYITIYTLIMTLVVSVVLAFAVTGLKPFHDAAEAVFKKRDILSAIEGQLPKKLVDMSDEEVLSLFDSKVEQVVINASGETLKDAKAESIDMAAEEKKPENERRYPLFIFKGEKGLIYLMSIRGNGLWDKISAYVALENDLNTIAGASFAHLAETPGLGAEIKDNPNFPKQFIGKKLLTDQGEYVSVKVVKGGVKDPLHEVDGISGATITSTGVSEMMVRGLEVYLPYLESQKNKAMAETTMVKEKERQEVFGPKERKLITDPLGDDNPVTVQVLGVCSALAVTTMLKPALIMAIAVTLVTGFSNLVISLMRNGIPKQIRMIVQLVVIAFLVTVVEQVLKAYSYPVWKQLSVFIGLIITNCIVMGRLEAFAMANPPWRSFLDGIGNGAGYGLILIAVAAIREFFGRGALYGYKILGATDEFLLNTSKHWWLSWYQPNGLMVIPASAIFLVGIFIWIQRSRNPKLVDIS